MTTALAQHLLAEVDKKDKEIARLKKSLKTLARPENLESPRKVKEACKLLEQADPGVLGLDVDFTELLEWTAADQRKRVHERKLEFGRELKESVERRGLSCEMMTTDPMAFSLPPFTVSVDFDRNLATIHYARLDLETLPAKPDRILSALQKHLKRLKAGWSSEQFFDALYHAYCICLFEINGSAGDRIPLSDLLAHVALSFQNDKYRADPTAENYRAYGRVRMAYDLSRLRRKGLLQRHGRRLNLGAATGTSTRNKKDVLFIEDSPGKGQYYLSIWYVLLGG